MGMYAFLSKGDLIEMNNKKLSRLLEPNLKLYFLCMIAVSYTHLVDTTVRVVSSASPMRKRNAACSAIVM